MLFLKGEGQRNNYSVNDKDGQSVMKESIENTMGQRLCEVIVELYKSLTVETRGDLLGLG